MKWTLTLIHLTELLSVQMASGLNWLLFGMGRENEDEETTPQTKLGVGA